MKRKMLAVLLSCAVFFGNTVPAAAFSGESPESFAAAEDEAGFAAVSEKLSEETDEPLFSNEEKTFDAVPAAEENEALAGTEEILRIDDPVEWYTAGTGIAAAPSAYREGSSFGRQQELKELNGFPAGRRNYAAYHAVPETISYYSDANGKLHIVAADTAKKCLYDLKYDGSKITEKTTLKLPLPEWGGFYAAPDGNFYLAVGQNNTEENGTKTVVKILKYSANWQYLGETDIPGGVFHVFPGIYLPFDAASLRMTMIGNTLVVHTGREMFGMDGLHHQSNITFQINTSTMLREQAAIPYVSHSFNQFVVNDGSSIYYLDHGDAYDRGLILSKYSHGGGGLWESNIFPFMGQIGENYTGCQVTGFALEGNTLLTVGKSVPHWFGVGGVTGYDSNLNKNIFLIRTDTDSGRSEFSWLTNYAASGNSVELGEPKLVKTDAGRYAVLFSEEQKNRSILHFLQTDGDGTVLLTKDFEGVSLQSNSQPILIGNSICWVSENFDDGNYGGDPVYLYKIPIVTVPMTGAYLAETTLKLNEGAKKTLVMNFEPQTTDDVRDVFWKSSNPAAATVSKNGVVTGKGYGTAVITAECGSYTAKCKVNVVIPNSDQPLATPVVKVTQTRADKLHLSWKKVSGSKGYQIYYATSKNGSYRKIETLKSALLSYDAALPPGKTYYFKVRAYGTNTKGKTKYSKFSAVAAKKAVVPTPAGLTCGFGSKGTQLNWTKVTGASGYAVYKNGKLCKICKYTELSWKDTAAYDSATGMYWIADYYVRAYRTVNGKKIYSSPTKTVNLWVN